MSRAGPCYWLHHLRIGRQRSSKMNRQPLLVIVGLVELSMQPTADRRTVTDIGKTWSL